MLKVIKESEMENELKKLFYDGAKEFNIELSSKQIDDFFKYKDILKQWNEKINLTAIEEDKDILIKHFLDSLSIIPVLLPAANDQASDLSLIDVGTGAGFPGIPVKIILNNIKVTLFDSLEKRVKFLDEVIRELKLNKIEAIHGRAEDFGVRKEYRETFDVVTARAVANLPVLLEYCLPFVKTGGLFIAMKGSNTEEIEDATKALEILGGKIEEIKEVTLPFSDFKRNIILIRKLRQMPLKYPRKAGKPSKEPLI
jgi:16S rRNA (guanine527-N7)-methyltransferase